MSESLEEEIVANLERGMSAREAVADAFGHFGVVVVEPWRVRREFFAAHEAVCTGAAVRGTLEELRVILEPEGDVSPREALAAAVRKIVAVMPDEVLTIARAAEVSGRDEDAIREEWESQGAAEGSFSREDWQSQDASRDGRAEISAVVRELQRQELEEIAAGVAAALFLDRDGEIDTEGEVSGADFLATVSGILEENGLAGPSIAKGVGYKIQNMSTTNTTSTGAKLAAIARTYLQHAAASQALGGNLWSEFRDACIQRDSSGADLIIDHLSSWLPMYCGNAALGGHDSARELLEDIGASAKADGLVMLEDAEDSDYDCGAHLLSRVVIETMYRSIHRDDLAQRDPEMPLVRFDPATGTYDWSNARPADPPGEPNMEEAEKYLSRWDAVLIARIRENFENPGLSPDLAEALTRSIGGRQP